MSRKIVMKEAMKKYGVTERTVRRRIKKFNVTRYVDLFHNVTYNDDELEKAFASEEPIKTEDGTINWELANCQGIATDLFFLEDDALKVKGLEYSMIRGVCFVCPIRKQCLDWAYKIDEEYGMLGGVSAIERRIIAKKDFNNRLLGALKRDLEEWGVSLHELYESSKAKEKA